MIRLYLLRILLNENEYTVDSWNNFSTALSFAENAINKNYSYTNSAVDTLKNGVDSLSAAIEGLEKIQTAVNDNNTPINFSLSQNYPNPFNPTTMISYSIPHSGYITLKVYNLLGEEIATLFEGFRKSGDYVANFNASGLASGIYLYRFSAENFTATKKFVLLK